MALDLVEAALRTDRRHDAVAHVQAVKEAGLAALSPRMALLSTAATAMTAPDDEVPALFDQALGSADAERWPFERARVHLLFGERLRRMRAVTPQELEIARLAAAGLSNKQIGDRLFMSHRTVGSHLYRIFPKLGVTSRAALSSALPRPDED